MAIIIFSAAGQAFTFGNPTVHQVVSRYLGRAIEPPKQGLEIPEADNDNDNDNDNDSDGDGDDDVDDDDDADEDDVDDHLHLMEADDAQKDTTPTTIPLPGQCTMYLMSFPK